MAIITFAVGMYILSYLLRQIRHDKMAMTLFRRTRYSCSRSKLNMKVA